MVLYESGLGLAVNAYLNSKATTKKSITDMVREEKNGSI